MSNQTLQCDSCGETHDYTFIMEKPKRFAFKNRIHDLPVINQDRRTTDNTCLSCLSEEMEQLKECY